MPDKIGIRASKMDTITSIILVFMSLKRGICIVVWFWPTQGLVVVHELKTIGCQIAVDSLCLSIIQISIEFA